MLSCSGLAIRRSPIPCPPLDVGPPSEGTAGLACVPDVDTGRGGLGNVDLGGETAKEIMIFLFYDGQLQTSQSGGSGIDEEEEEEWREGGKQTHT